ncbi:O-antigen ligase family protein [Ferrigenium sp. UT5]|uniref:O-antigen ligase family protein n=1 Tax=Ferrigenium sp. UT5 TaxID=3242105 RepID=UPI0035501E0A
MKSSIQLNRILTGNVPVLVVLSYPALCFLVQGGMNGAMFVLAALALYGLGSGCRRGEPLTAPEIAFGIAMASGLVAIFLVQLYHQDLAARYFDSASRFLLAVPILYALRQAGGTNLFSVLQYAFPLGALAALGAVAVYLPSFSHSASLPFLNHIHLGDMALLLGFLSVLGINWTHPDHPALKLFKLAGFGAGLLVSILSQARGGWIALPLFVAFLIHAHTHGNYWKKLAWGLVLVGMLALLSYLFIGTIHSRVGMIFSDLAHYQTGHLDTSIGIRLQLWNAAVQLIAAHPIFGVGADGFGQAMGPMSALHQVTPLAAEYGRGEAHSEILGHAARFGVLGLCALLAVYFVPLYFFMRLAKSGLRRQAVAARMGICVTLGFFIFGLTAETFDLKMTAAFYATTVAVLLAAAMTRADE